MRFVFLEIAITQQSISNSDLEFDSQLGKNSSYTVTYSPELLFPIPRAYKRSEIGIVQLALPFHGLDRWNAYELSWLDTNGKPMVATAEILFPADSTNIVESKSMKLYFNSYNQTKFATPQAVQQTIKNDLTAAAGASVSVHLNTPETWAATTKEFEGVCIDNLTITTDIYEVDPSLLSADASAPTEESLYSHLLKSNCLVTGQPDWATVSVHYRGPKISREGLLKYIVSYRQHQGFHEQCVERIFVDIMERCSPEALTVYARYTRRGGLDISPFRSNFQQYDDNCRHHRQ